VCGASGGHSSIYSPRLHLIMSITTKNEGRQKLGRLVLPHPSYVPGTRIADTVAHAHRFRVRLWLEIDPSSPRPSLTASPKPAWYGAAYVSDSLVSFRLPFASLLVQSRTSASLSIAGASFCLQKAVSLPTEEVVHASVPVHGPFSITRQPGTRFQLAFLNRRRRPPRRSESISKHVRRVLLTINEETSNNRLGKYVRNRHEWRLFGQ
jgi:hypothetical protein